MPDDADTPRKRRRATTPDDQLPRPTGIPRPPRPSRHERHKAQPVPFHRKKVGIFLALLILILVLALLLWWLG